MSVEIHPTALVSPSAELGEGTEVGPYCIIEEDVRIGRRNHFEAHCVIKRGTQIGNENHFFEHAVIGGTPQDLKFNDDPSFVSIGDGNVFREGVTVHRGTHKDSQTRVGDRNYLMVNVHVAHNCRLENHLIIANNVALAGEVEIEEGAFISGGVVIHQFSRVGRLAMIGGNAKIIKDVLPFCVTDGIPARTRGINLVGLKRAGFSDSHIRNLKQAYRILLRSHLALSEAIARLLKIGSEPVLQLVHFLEQSQRGFHRERERSD